MRTLLPVVSMLAWRNLWRNYQRTLIMLAAVMLGVWAMVVMTALYRGLIDGMLNDGIKYLPGHAQIHDPRYRDDPGVEHSMAMPAPTLLRALSAPGIEGWAARVKIPAVISSERDSRGVMLLGIDPAQEVAVGFDTGDIIAGRFLESPADKGVVVGQRLLERLETRLGRRVVLMSQTTDNQLGEQGFRIVGVFKAQQSAREESVIYAGRAVVQRLVGMGASVSEVAILGSDYRQLEPWYSELERALDDNSLVLEEWRTLDGYLSLGLAAQDSLGLVLIIVIFTALAFGLVNTMAMAVFERVREIGLMLALGMQPRAVLMHITIEVFYLLVIGLILGNLLAWVTLLALQSGIDLSAIAQAVEMAGISSILYPHLQTSDMIQATVIVVVLGLLASLIPAWRAAHLDPVKALNEH